ncbi:WD40 repeat domain-containing protein, partial [Scytonema sp. HK-05]|uniref:WD40 repeat domain-containing protein n=1 Tax=Scytonema sp. HK-05 TaxID=1137095 RepID=UPI001E37E03E
IKLWDVATSKELKTLNGHSSSVSSVAFSRDGKTMASGSHDNTIKLWDVYLDDLNALMRRSCDRVRAYLQTNPNVRESDRHLCDGIGNTNEK